MLVNRAQSTGCHFQFDMVPQRFRIQALCLDIRHPRSASLFHRVRNIISVLLDATVKKALGSTFEGGWNRERTSEAR